MSCGEMTVTFLPWMETALDSKNWRQVMLEIQLMRSESSESGLKLNLMRLPGGNFLQVLNSFSLAGTSTGPPAAAGAAPPGAVGAGAPALLGRAGSLGGAGGAGRVTPRGGVRGGPPGRAVVGGGACARTRA